MNTGACYALTAWFKDKEGHFPKRLLYGPSYQAWLCVYAKASFLFTPQPGSELNMQSALSLLHFFLCGVLVRVDHFAN